MRITAASSLIALVVTVVGSSAALSPGVVFVPADKAKAALQTGNTTIVPKDEALGLRVSTGLKTAPRGDIEQHGDLTHVFLIQSGEGTLIIGGTIVGAKELRPGEWTGTDIQGGDAHHLKAGDVITVPVGVPHWWKDVPREIRYYAVHVYAKR